MTCLQNVFRFPKKTEKSINDAFASVFTGDPHKPLKISGAMTPKNVFNVFEITLISLWKDGL